VLDLFSGCGGIALGFERAGAEIAGGIDSDPFAARTFATNFHGGDDRFEERCRPVDITTVSPDELAERWSVEPFDRSVDIVVGGPPCQAFARIGRAKLRSLSGSATAHVEDERAGLYEVWLNWIDRIRPLAVLMENVPDILNFNRRNLAEEVCDRLSSIGPGYDAVYTLANAAFFGVPQARDRVILIALRTDLGRRPGLPEATHSGELPKGYASSRTVAMKRINRLFGPYMDIQSGGGRMPFVTAGDAISDLPVLKSHLTDGRAPGAGQAEGGPPYRRKARSDHARLMRTWNGHEAGDRVTLHITRRLPRDYATFARMAPGEEYPAALKHAEARFAEQLAELKREGRTPAEGSETWATERRAIVPPYDVTKFPNRWWKLREDAPSRTLTAHIGKDTYSHIHYDSDQARTITVREAARLHSFPDGFEFAGRMNAVFRQIGNAVPPLMAAAFASCLFADLRRAAADRAWVSSEAAE
jgi:DNA (cytosine-5)-methyltransferase 1